MPDTSIQDILYKASLLNTFIPARGIRIPDTIIQGTDTPTTGNEVPNTTIHDTRDDILDIRDKDTDQGIVKTDQGKVMKYGVYNFKCVNKYQKRKKKLVQLYKETRGNIGISCKGARIARYTFTLWLEDDPEFKRAIDDVEQDLNDEVRDALIGKAVDKHDMQAIQFQLRKRDARYADSPTTLQQFNISDRMKLEIVSDE